MAESVDMQSIADVGTPVLTPEEGVVPAESGRRVGSMLATLPEHIRRTDPRLPATYEQAKTALAQCSRIDECQEWANKAEALASYARQADDHSLRKLADRIQARAVRRCGELLKQFDGRPQNAMKQNDGGGTLISRREAAANAGMSKDQQVTAVRVANVPRDQFEQAVDGEKPLTVTALAGLGKQQRPSSAPAAATAPVGFKQATHLIGVVRDFAAFCEENDPVAVAGGLMQSDVIEVRTSVGVIDGWLDRLVVNLSPDAQSGGPDDGGTRQ